MGSFFEDIDKLDLTDLLSETLRKQVYEEWMKRVSNPATESVVMVPMFIASGRK